LLRYPLPAACYSVNLGKTADLSWITSETGKQDTLGRSPVNPLRIGDSIIAPIEPQSISASGISVLRLLAPFRFTTSFNARQHRLNPYIKNA